MSFGLIINNESYELVQLVFMYNIMVVKRAYIKHNNGL